MNNYIDLQVKCNSTTHAINRMSSIQYENYKKYVQNFVLDNLNLLNTNKKAKFLDCGTNFGDEAIFFESKEFDVTSIDLSEEFTKNFHNAIVADIHDLKCFDDNTFDIIYANNVLEHSHRIDKAIEELSRVMKKTGFFVASIPLDGEIPDLGKNESHLWKISSEDAFRYFSRNNWLKIIRMEFINSFELFGLRHMQSCDKFMTFLAKKH